MGYSLSITQEAKEFIAKRGYDKQFGARPLRRAIQQNLEDPISELIIETDPPKGSELLAQLQDEKIKLTVVDKNQDKDKK